MNNTHLQQQQALCMAYLSYCGEQISAKGNKRDEAALKTLELINENMPKQKVLLDSSGKSDWEVVWGPALYTFPCLAKEQDNMMYVVQQKSNRDNYIVAIRGTNGTAYLDWVKEDFEVLRQKSWHLPMGKKVSGKPKVSHATHTGFEILLKKCIPTSSVKASGQSISAFLTSIASKNRPSTVTFTGHSLAGALSPTLALWFAQFQGEENLWDASCNVDIKVVAFAGATPGNGDFANYFDALLGSKCDRIHNKHDIVPHAWEMDTLNEIPTLYSSIGIKLNEKEKLAFDAFKEFLKCLDDDYVQLKSSLSFTYGLNNDLDSLGSQAEYQHVCSYADYFGLCQLALLRGCKRDEISSCNKGGNDE